MFITNETGQPLIGKVVWEKGGWGLWAGDRAAVQGKSQIQKPCFLCPTMSSGTEASGGSSLGVTRTSDKYLGFPEYEGDLRHEQLGPTQV